MLNRNRTPDPASPQAAPALATLPRQACEAKKHRAATKSAYARDIQKFAGYGFQVPCTADDLLAFLRTQVKRVAPATALRRVMAVQYEHRRLGHPSPTGDSRVREVLRYLAAGQVPVLDAKVVKSAGTKASKAPAKKPSKSAVPITRSMITRVFDCMGSGRRASDLRDRALMLLGFCGMRRGVITRLDIEDCTWTEDALLLRLRAEASDDDESDTGTKARTLAIPRTRGPLCAATAVEAWLDFFDRRHQTGPLFVRFDRGGDPVFEERLDAAWINAVIKRRMKDAGYDDVEKFSAESLRRGGAMEKAR